MNQSDFNANMEKAICAEQVRMLYAAMPSAAAAYAVMVSVTAAAQWSAIDHRTIMTWLTATLLIVFLRLILFFNFRKHANYRELNRPGF